MLADEEYRFPPNVNHLIATARYDECRMMVKPDSKNMGTKHYKVIPSRHYEERNFDFTEAEREEAKQKLKDANGGPIPFQKHDAHRFRRLTEMTMLLEMAAEFAYKNLRENHG